MISRTASSNAVPFARRHVLVRNPQLAAVRIPALNDSQRPRSSAWTMSGVEECTRSFYDGPKMCRESMTARSKMVRTE